jgi:hypothetical protein
MQAPVDAFAFRLGERIGAVTLVAAEQDQVQGSAAAMTLTL